MHRFLICENRLRLLHSTQCSDPVCCTDTHTDYGSHAPCLPRQLGIFCKSWRRGWWRGWPGGWRLSLSPRRRLWPPGPARFLKTLHANWREQKIFVFKRRVSRDYYLYFFSFKAIRPEINGVLLMVYTVLFESLLCAAHRGARQILWSAGYTKVRIYAI